MDVSRAFIPVVNRGVFHSGFHGSALDFLGAATGSSFGGGGSTPFWYNGRLYGFLRYLLAGFLDTQRVSHSCWFSVTGRGGETTGTFDSISSVINKPTFTFHHVKRQGTLTG
jgi:hypothetical protein